MEKKIENRESRNHWTVVHRSAIPQGAKTIKAIWSFKRKRRPDGALLKDKTRLCAHGGMQQWGDNYWETYSPVVNMLSVRLLLAVTKIFKHESKAIDFGLAFSQADLDVDMWMYLPIGFQVDRETEEDSEKNMFSNSTRACMVSNRLLSTSMRNSRLGFRTGVSSHHKLICGSTLR